MDNLFLFAIILAVIATAVLLYVRNRDSTAVGRTVGGGSVDEGIEEGPDSNDDTNQIDR